MTDINKILEEREKTHGSFEVHANVTQNIKKLLSGYAGWDELGQMQKEALEMIANKIGRIIAGKPNFIDHWDDIAGYATLVANKLREVQK
jgi:hypothetical protein